MQAPDCAVLQHSACLPQKTQANLSFGSTNLCSSDKLAEKDSPHRNPGCRSGCHRKSELEVNSLDARHSDAAFDDAALHQQTSSASDVRAKTSSGSSDSSFSASTMVDEVERSKGRPCYKSQQGRRSKFEVDKAMAAKYLPAAFDSALPQQPTCLPSDSRMNRSASPDDSPSSATLAEESLERRPRYRAPRNPQRNLEVDDSILELLFDVGHDFEDPTEADQHQGAGACRTDPFASDFIF